MWFLQTDTLIIVTCVTVFIAVMRWKYSIWGVKIPINYLLPLLDIAVLIYISKRLAVLYLLYVAGGYLATVILYKLQKNRLFFFVLFCLLSSVPFFMSRISSIGMELPFLFVAIGISYNMFKIIDGLYYVYYAQEPIDALTYVNYILFIPVFTAGPIFRYRDFAKTFANPALLTAQTFEYCVKRIIRGLFKKMVLVEIFIRIFDHLRTLQFCWYVSLSIIAMSYLLLYLDLSGYSDVAIAYGKIAGLDVPENIKKPLSSPSLTQFWRNWHVTLSDFIREHIYVVVAKKHLNRFHSGLIGFFTMLIMTLWHGFNVPYLIAGVYNGTLIMLENLFSLTTVNKRNTNKYYFVFRCFLTNFLFAMNTLMFTLHPSEIIPVLTGLFKI